MVKADVNEIIAREGVAVVDKAFYELGKFEFALQTRTEGITSFTLEVTLAGNAVVRQFDLEVTARRADEIPLEQVGQVRASTTTEGLLAGSGTTVVIDFGVLRTVSGVNAGSDSELELWRVKSWMGTGFAPSPIYQATLSAAPRHVTATSPSSRTLIFFPETRTERLMIDMVGSASAASLASSMTVFLPENPSDLELRIDGAAPAWTWPGPVQPGSETPVTADAWNKSGTRRISLVDALAKLTGDPTAPAVKTLKLVLSSRVPGDLALTAKTQKISYIRRALFNNDPSRDLTFSEEGRLEIDLAGIVPAGSSRAIEEIQLTATAKLPPERVVPPVGPEVASATGVPVLAELSIDPQHAAVMRVPAASGLSELTAIRLPLTPGASGAEVRVVFWSADPDGGEPLEALKQGTTEPVQLEAGSGEQWCTFGFAKPIALKEDARPWAVVVVTRGAASWALGAAPPQVASGPGSGLAADNELRRGPPAGPWTRLPGTFQTGSLKHLRGRMRLVGHAPEDKPLAPLILELVGGSSAVELTPGPKGTPATLKFSPAVSVTKATLRVTSRTPGSVSLKNIDVVSTT